MRRMLNLLEFALNGLYRRKTKNIALIIIYAAVVGFFASVIFFTNSLRYESRVIMMDIPELWIQKLTGGRLQPVSLAIQDSIRNIRGIKQIIPRVWGYYYDSPTAAVYTITGSDSSFSDSGMISSGFSGILDSSSALCGSGFLEQHNLETGGIINLVDPEGHLRSYTIKGSFETSSELLTRDLIVLTVGSARQILGLPSNYVTDLAIRIHNPDEVDNIAAKISRRFPSVRAVTREQLQLTYDALFGWRGGIFTYGSLISVLSFLILAWDRAAGLSKEEKRELGILKGLGWQINDVLLVKFWEGIVISLSAALLGITAALVHIYVLNGWLLKPFFTGWSVLYPAYDLKLSVDGGSLLVILVLSVVPYLAATVIPAWKGAITDPAEVMQTN